MNSINVTDSIRYVGVNDKRIKLFEGQYIIFLFCQEYIINSST